MCSMDNCVDRIEANIVSSNIILVKSFCKRRIHFDLGCDSSCLNWNEHSFFLMTKNPYVLHVEETTLQKRDYIIYFYCERSLNCSSLRHKAAFTCFIQHIYLLNGLSIKSTSLTIYNNAAYFITFHNYCFNIT